MSDKLILQLDRNVFDKILSYGIDTTKYVLKPVYKDKVSETELLLNNEVDRKELLESVNDIENGKNLVKVNFDNLLTF